MAISREDIESIAKATAAAVVERLNNDGKEQIDFEFEYKGYTMAGFTKPQEGIGTFNRAKEDALVRSCHEKIAEVFGNPNKFERRLARMEDIPIDKPATKRLYNNIIYTDSREYYCAGSGGRGGGKVFWTPYTIENEELRKKIADDDMCDNCKTASHESQHGIDAATEFDSFSDLPAIYNRLEHFPKGERLEDSIFATAWTVEGGCMSNFKKRYRRKERNKLCAINERYPKELREVLRERGLPNERIDKLIECACSKSGEEA